MAINARNVGKKRRGEDGSVVNPEAKVETHESSVPATQPRTFARAVVDGSATPTTQASQSSTQSQSQSQAPSPTPAGDKDGPGDKDANVDDYKAKAKDADAFREMFKDDFIIASGKVFSSGV